MEQQGAPAPRPTRPRWEVAAAVGIFLAVLLVIDLAALHEPALAFALAPFVFLTVAATMRVTIRGVAVFSAALVIAATWMGDLRYAGLAYPAVALGLLIVVQGLRKGEARP